MKLFGRVRKHRLNEIKDQFGAGSLIKVCDNANYRGRQSNRMKQIQGNGVLALSDDYLIFFMWYPKKKLVIPRNQIISVETTKSFRGRYRSNRPLLKINFYNEMGEKDAAAWIVFNLNSWMPYFPQKYF